MGEGGEGLSSDPYLSPKTKPNTKLNSDPRLGMLILHSDWMGKLGNNEDTRVTRR